MTWQRFARHINLGIESNWYAVQTDMDVCVCVLDDRRRLDGVSFMTTFKSQYNWFYCVSFSLQMSFWFRLRFHLIVCHTQRSHIIQTYINWLGTWMVAKMTQFPNSEFLSTDSRNHFKKILWLNRFTMRCTRARD